MNETKPKKMVSRKIAIALGIICIIVAVGLLGALVYYVNLLDSEISDKDSTISGLNTQISYMHGQLNNLNAIANLNASSEYWSTLIGGSSGQGYQHYVDYAGYIFVVATSLVPVNLPAGTQPNSSFVAEVELSYSLPNGITYDKGLYLNETQNTVWFPVFPANINLSVFSSTGVAIDAKYYY